jgi:hypothetical protein
MDMDKSFEEEVSEDGDDLNFIESIWEALLVFTSEIMESFINQQNQNENDGLWL